MKRNVLAALACAAVVCLSGTAGAVTISVGTGADVSFFVLESPNIGIRTYEVHYTYDASSPLTGWELLQIVDSAESDLSISATNYGGGIEPDNYFLSAITWLGVTETNDPSYNPSWVQAVSGGSSGYPSLSPVADGTWVMGSGLSYREVVPGSWDGLLFGVYGTTPSVAPVPEPSVSLLGGAGLALVWRRRRTR